MTDDIFRTVHLKFSDAELVVVDEWKKRKKIRTRSEAIRQLIRCGLEGDDAITYRMEEKPQGFLRAAMPPALSPDLTEFIQQEIALAVAKALKPSKE